MLLLGDTDVRGRRGSDDKNSSVVIWSLTQAIVCEVVFSDVSTFCLQLIKSFFVWQLRFDAVDPIERTRTAAACAVSILLTASVWDDLTNEQSLDTTTSNSRTLPSRKKRIQQHSSTKSVRLCYLELTSRTDNLLPSLVVFLADVTPSEKGQQCGSLRQVARQATKGASESVRTLCHCPSRGFAISIQLQRIDWNLQFKEFLDHFHKIVSQSIL